jgi:hypothetical protein
VSTNPVKGKNSATEGDAPEEIDCPAGAPHNVGCSFFGIFDHLEASQGGHGLG